MANYSLTVGSNFEPFSFERFVQPLQMYGEAYREIEDNLSALETAAGEWELKANELSDPIAHALYLKYAEDLRQLADDLSRYGLNPATRRKMLNMRKRYSSEIVPIAEAWTRRQLLADEQRAAWLQDPSIRFSTDFKTASLDELLANPNANYDPLSGKWIENEAATLVSNLAKTALQNPKYERVMDNQYWEIRQQTGYTREEIDDAFNGKGPKELRMMIDDIHKSIKSTGNRAYDKDFVDSSIRKGFYAGGIGGVTTSYQNNGEYMSAAARAQIATQRYGIDVSAATTRRGLDMLLKMNRENNATQLKIASMRGSGGAGGLGGVTLSDLQNATPGQLSDNSIAYYGNNTYDIVKMNNKEGYFEALFFDSSGEHGDGGFLRKTVHDSENHLSAYTPRGTWAGIYDKSLKDLNGNGRNAVMDYTRQLFGSLLPDGVIQQIASNLTIIMDRDAFSDNHWCVTLPGVNWDGSVQDESKVRKFYSKATQIIRDYEGSDKKPGVANATTKK